MQDVSLNSSTPIFKIRILAQIVSHDFLRKKPFTRKTFSFQRTNSYWTLKCWNEHLIRIRLVAIGQSVKNYPTIQCKFLWILKLRVHVFGKASRIQFNEFCLAVFWHRLLIGWPIRYCKWNDIELSAFQKIGKDARGRLELLTSI